MSDEYDYLFKGKNEQITKEKIIFILPSCIDW